jgi:beta-xylosidase
VKTVALRIALAIAVGVTAPAQAKNPVVPGWYADPELRIFEGRYWLYPTYSADFGIANPAPMLSTSQKEQREQDGIYPPFLKQTFFDVFSSPDLVNWTKHSRALDVRTVAWAAYALWAPSVVEHEGRYYFFFGANDIKNDNQLGGIGVAVSDKPEGPFEDALGRPLIGKIHNGAQPIDQMVFRDDGGVHYMYYGGWKHLNVVKLAPDLLSIVPFPDGETYKEITPDPRYVEGSFVTKRNGIYYLMWSEGEWTAADYSVAYAMSASPFGPFKRIGKILEQDATVARGAGHHSVLNIPGTNDWYIAYHRRPLDTQEGSHREVAIERLSFNPDGTIRPVVMTHSGVPPRPLAVSAGIPR